LSFLLLVGLSGSRKELPAHQPERSSVAAAQYWRRGLHWPAKLVPCPAAANCISRPAQQLMREYAAPRRRGLHQTQLGPCAHISTRAAAANAGSILRILCEHSEPGKPGILAVGLPCKLPRDAGKIGKRRGREYTVCNMRRGLCQKYTNMPVTSHSLARLISADLFIRSTCCQCTQRMLIGHAVWPGQ